MAFTDNFNAASTEWLEDRTPSGGTAWTRIDGVVQAIGASGANDDCRTNSSTATAYQCDDQGSADQYLQFVAVSVSFASFWACRQTNSVNYIGVRIAGGKIQVYKNEAGSFTQIGSTGSTTVVATDVVRLECNGTAIAAKLNGSTEVSGTSSFNQTVKGQGPVCRVTGEILGDDFEAGALGGGGTTSPYLYYHQQAAAA